MYVNLSQAIFLREPETEVKPSRAPYLLKEVRKFLNGLLLVWILAGHCHLLHCLLQELGHLDLYGQLLLLTGFLEGGREGGRQGGWGEVIKTLHTQKLSTKAGTVMQLV